MGADQRNHIAVVVGAPGKDIDPVGVQGAGAVKLLPVQPPAVFARRHPGFDFAQLQVADFTPAAADQFTIGKPAEPLATPFAVGLIQAIFDKGEMRAQRLRQVGVGFGQFSQQLEQLRQAGTQSALLDRDAQGAESGLLQPADWLIGQRPLVFPRDRAFGNLVEDRAESGGQNFVIRVSGFRHGVLQFRVRCQCPDGLVRSE